MKISACLIAKNEESNIARCIQSVKGTVDEIIVVDTGSTDKTKEVARNLGAKVYDYEWDDNFANARNAALKKAKGEWIVFLDADEYFYYNSGRNIRQILRSIPKGTDILFIKMLHLYDDNNICSTDYMARIFRNDGKIRYRGKIHETVERKDRDLNAFYVPENELTIYHTGYQHNIHEKKMKRNLRMLLGELNNGNESPLTHFYLSNCYSVLKEYEKAISHAKISLSGGIEDPDCSKTLYLILAECMEHLTDKYTYADIISELHEGISKDSGSPDLFMQLGLTHFKNQRYTESLKALEKTGRLLSIHNTNSDYAAYLHDTYFYTGLIHELSNNYVKAIEYYVKSLRVNNNRINSKALLQLARILINENPEDIIALLNNLYDFRSKPVVEFLVYQFAHLGYPEIVTYLYDLLQKSSMDNDSLLPLTLLATGNYSAAFDKNYEVWLKNKNDSIELILVVTALLNDEFNKIQLIRQCVKPSLAKIIDAYSGQNIELNQEEIAELISVITTFIDFNQSRPMEQWIKLCFKYGISKEIGEIFLQRNYFGYAAQTFEDAFKTNGSDTADLYFSVGYCNYKMGKYETAVDLFDKAIEQGYKNYGIIEYLQWTDAQCSSEELKQKIHGLIRLYRPAAVTGVNPA